MTGRWNVCGDEVEGLLRRKGRGSQVDGREDGQRVLLLDHFLLHRADLFGSSACLLGANDYRKRGVEVKEGRLGLL